MNQNIILIKNLTYFINILKYKIKNILINLRNISILLI